MSLATLFSQLKQSNTGNISNLTPPTTRFLDSEPDLTGVTINVDGTGSVAAVRGNATVDTGSTLQTGYLYGVQGKLTIKGTIDTTHSEYQAALAGQLDVSAAAAAFTAGNLAILWLDTGDNTGAAFSLNSVDAIKITNTGAGANSVLNSILQLDAQANFLIDAPGYASTYMKSGASGGSNSQNLKVRIGGTTYYIQLYA
jgi:hypothetical protein